MTTARLIPDAGPAICRALVGGGPQTAREVAERARLEERYVREWLGRQAEHGCVTYDAMAEIFLLTPEQEARLVVEAVQEHNQEVGAMAGIQIKNFESPDEVRPFEGNGRADVVDIGDRVVGRTTLEPGWRWSKNVKPIANTDSCQVSHLGYCLSGRMKLIMDDGSEREVGAGDVAAIPPGHDAEVVGGEPCVFIDFGEFGDYAKRH